MLRIPPLGLHRLELVLLLVGPPVVAFGLLAPEVRPDAMDPSLATIVVLALTPMTQWGLVSLVLLWSQRGRSYVAEAASDGVTKARLDERPYALTMAGLVFAAAVLTGLSESSTTTQLLIATTVAFLVTWMAGFQPQRRTSSVLSDGLHWIALATLLATVVIVAPSTVIILLAITSLVALAGYSGANGLAYLMEAGLVTRVRRPKVEEA